MSTVSDYVGRSVDLVVYQGVQAGGPHLLTPALALSGQPGLVVSGVQKLVQRFLIELFTEIGSIAFDEERGCNFLSELRNGEIRTQADLFSSFARAINLIEKTLVAEELATDPDDERYGSITPTSVTVIGNSGVIRATITSQAGSSAEFLFPIESVT